MNDLIERLRAVKWEVTDDGDRMPDDPTHKCVFVDMRSDDFRALLREAAAAIEAAEKDIALKERVIDSLGSALNAAAHERDNLRAKIEQMEKQEPVAKVRVHRTGCNAGLAWSVAPLNDFDSLPLMRDGEKLYALPGAKGEEK